MKTLSILTTVTAGALALCLVWGNISKADEAASTAKNDVNPAAATGSAAVCCGRCEADNFVTGEILLVLKPGVDIYNFADSQNLQVKRFDTASRIGTLTISTRDLDAGRAESLTIGTCVSLNKRPEVESAELNAVRKDWIRKPPSPGIEPATCKQKDFVTGEIIVKLKEGTDADGFASDNNLKIKIESPSGVSVMLVDTHSLSDADARQLTADTCAALNNEKNVLYADLNGRKQAAPPVATAPAASENAPKCLQKEFVPGQILLELDDKADLAAFAAAHKLTVKSRSPLGFALMLMDIEGLSEQTAKDMTRNTCNSLNLEPGVIYAELNGIVKAEPPATTASSTGSDVDITPTPTPAAPAAPVVSGPKCQGDDFKPGEILLKLKSGVDIKDFAESHNLKVKSGPDNAIGVALVLVNIEGRSAASAKSLTRAVCTGLNGDENVEYAELNYIMRAF